MQSCYTRVFSFFFCTLSTSPPAISFSSFSSYIWISRVERSSFTLFIVRSMLRLSSSNYLFEDVNIVSYDFSLSRSYYATNISCCSLLDSSKDLSPEALATFLSIYWIENSASYSNYCCFCFSCLSLFILACKFRDAESVPDMLPIKSA